MISSRYRTIKLYYWKKGGVSGRGSNSICEAGSSNDILEGAPPLVPQAGSPINPNNLVERLELLVLETKAGLDGLYDEMLKISKQQLSKNEQLDNLVFNYGK